MPRGSLVTTTRWPSELVLVRHGESVGNLADSEAREQKAERLDIELRDADVPLSETGQQQADAVGHLIDDLDDDRRPEVVVCSPYRRAAETAERALAAGQGHSEPVIDERLRERDLGAFDRLTWRGIEAEYAQEAERRNHVGKFYYQPPSGESWCDVTLRIRSLLHDLRDGYEGRRVWLFTHQAVIMSFRYVLEGLDEEELLKIDRSTPIANASITTFHRTDEGLELVSFADTEAVDRSSAERTHEPARAGRGSDAEG
jgi:broad specificity phosphatase PhoE